MAKSFTSLDDVKSAIEKMGFKIGDVWYDGNKSRPVFVCSREGLSHDIEVWAESPKYVNGVTIKDVSARDFDMVDGGEDEAGLKKAIRKALAYMGVTESRMKITIKEASMKYTSWFSIAGISEEDVSATFKKVLPKGATFRTRDDEHGGVYVEVTGRLTADDVGAILMEFLTDITDLVINEIKE